MPLGFRRDGPPFGRVLMLEERFRFGRDGGCDLVVHDLRVSRAHARARYVKGEVVVTAEEGALLFVNGKRVPFFALQPGDRVDLLPPDAPGPQRFVFENRLHGAFVPPGTSLVAAWLSHPSFLGGSDGPERYGVPAGAAAEGSVTLPGLDPATETRLAVRLSPPIPAATEVERALRLAARIAGAPHPGLAHVVDCAAVPSPQGARVWSATAWVEGRSADELVRAGPQPLSLVLRALVPAAYGVAWLHRRGVVHRDVSPANLLVRPDGRGVLIDYDQARSLGTNVPWGSTAAGTPGYVAPEEVLEGSPTLTRAVDVYGLAATAYALLTGRPPALGGDTLEAVAHAAKPPEKPSALGADVPDALDELLLRALAPDPDQRPEAADLARRLEGLRAALSVEA